MASAETASSDMIFDPPVTQLSTLRYARKLGVVFVVAAIIFGVASFFILLGLTSIQPTFPVIVGCMAVNGVFVLLLGFLVGREVYGLIRARQRGRAAARMHVRIVGLFGIVASFPAILVAIVAGITLDLGLDRIFDVRSKTIVDQSVSVSESYLGEAMRTLQVQSLNMARFLSQNRSQFVLDRTSFNNFMTGQSRVLQLRGAFILNEDGEELAKAAIPGSGPIAQSSQRSSQRGGCWQAGLPCTKNHKSCRLPHAG